MNENTITDLLLEKYVIDELSTKEKEMIEQKLLLDDSLKKKIETIRKSNEEILSMYSPGYIAGQIESRLNETPKAHVIEKKFNFIRLMPAFSLIVLIVCGIIITYSQLAPVKNSSIQEITRIKGETEIKIYRKTGNLIERLTNKHVVKNGDKLQISYIAGSSKYGMIFSIDGRRTITLHFPESKILSTALEQGEILLDFSYELDDAPDFERFFFVTSNERIDPEIVLNKIKKEIKDLRKIQTSDLDLAPGLNQNSILLIKGE